ncbi:hypothetical protein [Tenacibaculum singaporense]|uniref:DUF4935 domain-containing protein n=1 Tax=Tenacibaculum singaporense TaxID=2358479 RepID=A0A3S8R7Y8_9FLAO|nr:hypothetical protein [Tenacibaculum singaporense]AZJ35804.1 hypothetical protein D6T69_09855 [Tenacibaculum singaporense]
MGSVATAVLDACTVINLIHIDNSEEFLIKKLNKYLKIFISDKVFTEIKTNIFKNDIERDRIENAVSCFINYKVSDSLFEEFGKDFLKKVRSISNYKKDNGEFFSTALSLYYSQVMPSKLFFYTDDFTAKEDFSSFFDLHQIGGIKDTADLLLLLYRLDEQFSKRELIRLLSSLHSEYAVGLSNLISKLRDYINTLSPKLRKDKEFNEKLRKLIDKLHKHSLEDLGDFKSFFERKRGNHHKQISCILNEYRIVFDLQTRNNNYLDKIQNLIKYLEEKELYKFIGE